MVIKFRGRAIKDDAGKKITAEKTVCGNIWANEDNSYVIIGEAKDEKCFARNYEVEPKSVAQFIGYDATGAEIYSDDKIKILSGDETEICLAGIYFSLSDIGKSFDYVEVMTHDVGRK